jgi:hypothetical protein
MEHTKSNNNASNTQTGNGTSSETTVVRTKVPGVDNAQVILSQPDYVWENSSKPESRVIKVDRG